MPKVTKQSHRVQPKREVALAGVVSVGDMPLTGLKACVYGRGKTGKTTLACSFPGPLLIVGTEDGTKSVRSVKGIDFLRLTHSSTVDEIAAAVPGRYNSVVLDTAGGMQDMVLKEILGLDDIPVERSWGMAGREQWQACGSQTKERLRSLLNLADTDGVNVIIVAHERNFNDEGSGSDLIFPTVGAALTPSVAGWLNGACDYICQTFIREQTRDKVVKVGGKETAMSTKTGRVEYCLRVGPHPIFMTGFRRVHKAGEVMPDVIVDPSYEKLRELIDS